MDIEAKVGNLQSSKDRICNSYVDADPGANLGLGKLGSCLGR